MLQTKHAFMFLVATTLVFVLGVFSVVPDGIGTVASFLEPQTALVIQTETVEPGVEVIRDTTREDARANLMDKLKAYVENTDPVDGTAEVGGVVTLPIDIDEEISEEEPSSRIVCDPDALSIEALDWGPVNATIAEGARIIASLETDATGIPLRVLQLPLEPAVTGVTACLPNDMIAVALTGEVLTSGEAFQTMAEGLAGYAIDGFPLFGSYEDGRELTSADLDVCHGHVHTIIDQGVPVSTYHYHVTADAPYTLGCFRGTPVFE
jgi:hypothetical protein